MRRKLLSGILVTALGCLAVAGVAGAHSLGTTQVSIKAQSDGFFGFVKSSKPNTCANNRKVILYKQKGDHQKPHADQKIGSDLAQPNGNKYMWSTGNTGKPHGDYYALARPTPKCEGDSSKTIST